MINYMALSTAQRVGGSCPIHGAGEGAATSNYAVSTLRRETCLAGKIVRQFDFKKQLHILWVVFLHGLILNLLNRIHRTGFSFNQLKRKVLYGMEDDFSAKTNTWKRLKLDRNGQFKYSSCLKANSLICFKILRHTLLFGKIPTSETPLLKKMQSWLVLENYIKFVAVIAGKARPAYTTNMSKSDILDLLVHFLEGLTENKGRNLISEVLRNPNILIGTVEKAGIAEHFITLVKLSSTTDRCNQKSFGLNIMVNLTNKVLAPNLHLTKTTNLGLVPIGQRSTKSWNRRLAAILKDLQECLPKDVFEWDALPQELQQKVLEKVRFETIFRLRLVSKVFYGLPQHEDFQQARRLSHANEGSLSSMFFVIQKGKLGISGFDSVLQKWRRLPMTSLPPPNLELFKDYLIAGGGGLFCANVSKDPNVEALMVFNPLTQSSKELPPLKFRRHPVLMYVLACHETKGYKVIVAGSSRMDSPELSRKTEVYDSLTQDWKVIGDIPGEDFALNEYQTGAYSNGQLHCVAFVGNGTRKGVLACDVQRGIWHQDPTCFLPSSSCQRLGNNFTIAQLVETIKGVYLFTEQEEGEVVTQFLHKLEYNKPEDWKWTEVMREQKNCGRALLVYPEYTCVAHGDGKFCIFNTIEHTGVVYDIDDNTHELLPVPPTLTSNVESFHSLNPLSYTFQPNFTTCV